MELGDHVWITLLAVFITSTLSPALLSYLNNRNRRVEKAQDYERQDIVAARVETAAAQAAEAARLLVVRQDAAAAKAAEAARLLVTNTAKVAEATAQTNQKLDVIHTLVNSSMTAAMQSELEATKRVVVGLAEIIELKKKAGTFPDGDALALVKATEDRIAELSAALSDRLKQSETKER